MGLARFLATSDHLVAKATRGVVKVVRNASVPAPKPLVVPALHGVVAARELYYFGMRVLVCEPLFKGYCTEVGNNFHTGPYLHYVRGVGDIFIGDDVLLDGKIAVGFGARLGKPFLRIGSRTGIGHECSFTIGKSITIGDDCRIAGGAMFFDSSGHPSDPEQRKAGAPPDPDDVKPIVVEDNVWIGRRAAIFPGVRIGEGSIVSTGAIVMSDVAPYSIVAGNPARKIGTLNRANPNEVAAARAEVTK